MCLLDFLGLCAESSELAEMLEELDVEPMSLAWFVPRFWGILNQWLSIFLNWISFKSSWWLEDSNAVSLEVACPGRGRLVWCLCFMSQACCTVCSPCTVKPSSAVFLWGDCRSGQGFLEVVTVVAPGKWKYLTNITEKHEILPPSQVPIPGAICGNGQPITYNLIFFLDTASEFVVCQAVATFHCLMSGSRRYFRLGWV